MNLEAYVDDLVSNYGANIGCTFSYHYDDATIKDEAEQPSIDYSTPNCLPRYTTYISNLVSVYVDELSTDFVDVRFARPILLCEIIYCDDFDPLTAVVNYGTFNFESYANQINAGVK